MQNCLSFMKTKPKGGNTFIYKIIIQYLLSPLTNVKPIGGQYCFLRQKKMDKLFKLNCQIS